MFTGLSLLAWIIGLTVLWGCYIIATAMHREPTDVDVYCCRLDAEIDAQDEHDAMMRREVRL